MSLGSSMLFFKKRKSVWLQSWGWSVEVCKGLGFRVEGLGLQKFRT